MSGQRIDIKTTEDEVMGGRNGKKPAFQSPHRPLNENETKRYEH